MATGDLMTSTAGVRSRVGSYGRLLNMNLLRAACACDANRRVAPSGATLATAPAARLPPAPARFSTTNGCPSSSLKAGAVSRAKRSAVPPGGNGTIIVTGRFGHACAEAAHGDSSMTAAAKAMIETLSMIADLARHDRDQTLAVSGVIGARGLPCLLAGRAVARRIALRTVSGSGRSTPCTGPPLMVPRPRYRLCRNG